jgi:hypothetical protein
MLGDQFEDFAPALDQLGKRRRWREHTGRRPNEAALEAHRLEVAYLLAAGPRPAGPGRAGCAYVAGLPAFGLA